MKHAQNPSKGNAMNDADLKSHVARYTKRHEERLEATRKKVSDAFKGHHAVTSFELEALITDETHVSLWGALHKRHEKGQPLGEALAELKSHVEERIWNETPMNSTSVMANAMQIVQIRAQKQWVEVAGGLLEA